MGPRLIPACVLNLHWSGVGVQHPLEGGSQKEHGLGVLMMKSELSCATHYNLVVLGKFTKLLQAPGSSQMKDPAKCLM